MWRRLFSKRAREAYYVFAFAAAWLALMALARPPHFVADEGGWCDTGRRLFSLYGAELTDRGGRDTLAWRELLGGYGYDDPHMGPYAVGALAALGEHLGVAPWWLMVLVSATMLVLFFRLNEASFDRSTGIAGLVLLAVNPIFRQVAVAMMVEIPEGLFAVAALYAATRLDHLDPADETRAATGWAALAGCFAGLAASAKLYGAGVALALFLFGLTIVRRWGIRAVGFIVLAGVTAAAAFLITNPSVIADPRVMLHALAFGNLEGRGADMSFGDAAQWRAVWYAFTYPFVAFRPLAYDITDPIALPPVLAVDLPFLAIGYGLFAFGIARIVRERRGLPLAIWLAAPVLPTLAMVMSTPGQHATRSFFVPMLATVWIQAAGAPGAIAAIKGIRRRLPGRRRSDASPCPAPPTE